MTSPKKKQNSAVLEDFSPGRYDDDEMTLTPTEKLQNQSIGGQISFAIQLQAFQQESNAIKLQPKTRPINGKKLIPINNASIFMKRMKKVWIVSNFLHLCLNNMVVDSIASQKFKFFLNLLGQNYNSSTSRATNQQKLNKGQ